MSGDSAAVLVGKTGAPRLGTSLVRRTGLVERIQRGLGRRLTLIEAPAGFGKTTSVALAIADREPTVAWLTVDRRDNNPVRFAQHLVVSLDSALPGLADTLGPDIGPEMDFESFLTALAGEIDRDSTVKTLVLDDYHCIEDLSVHDLVARLLEAPIPLHVVISSRVTPPLPISRLRVRQELAQFGVDDLRFDDQEALGLVEGVSGLKLSPELIEGLERRTEGWAAGLQLAALSLSTTSDPESFVERFSGDHRYVLDFLMDEVWEHQPDDIRELLMKLSIVDRFDHELCEVFAGESSGGEVLDSLVRANLFLVQLDEQGHWFRFHRLFRDLLERRLRASNLDLAQLHRSAADAFERAGLRELELEHRYAAKDWPGMMAAALACQRELWTQPPIEWWPRLLEVPIEDALEHPRFVIDRAAALTYSGRFDLAFESLDRLRARVSADETRQDRTVLLKDIDTTRALALAVRSPDSREAVELVELYADQPSLDFGERARFALIRGIDALERGEVREAARAVSDLPLAAVQQQGLILSIAIAVRQAQLGFLSARFDEARRSLARLEQERVQRRRVPIVAATLIAVELAIEQADFEIANERLRQAFAMIEEGRPVRESKAHLLSARLALLDNDTTGARVACERAVAAAQQLGSPNQLRTAHAYAAWAALVGGDQALAADWLARQRDEPYSVLVAEREALVRARILLAQGELEQASREIEPVLIRCENQGRNGSLLEPLLVLAAIRREQGRRSQAEQIVSRALDLAEVHQRWGRFFEAPSSVLQLVAEALKVRHQKIEALAVLLENAQSEPSEKGPPDALVEPLSEREREVLSLLSVGLSNTEIGQRLHLSRNTVKTHLKNLYSKMMVHSRVQAVARARELELLRDS